MASIVCHPTSLPPPYMEQRKQSRTATLLGYKPTPSLRLSTSHGHSKDAQLKVSQYINTLSSYTAMQDIMEMRNVLRHAGCIFNCRVFHL